MNIGAFPFGNSNINLAGEFFRRFADLPTVKTRRNTEKISLVIRIAIHRKVLDLKAPQDKPFSDFGIEPVRPTKEKTKGVRHLLFGLGILGTTANEFRRESNNRDRSKTAIGEQKKPEPLEPFRQKRSEAFSELKNERVEKIATEAKKIAQIIAKETIKKEIKKHIPSKRKTGSGEAFSTERFEQRPETLKPQASFFSTAALKKTAAFAGVVLITLALFFNGRS